MKSSSIFNLHFLRIHSKNKYLLVLFTIVNNIQEQVITSLYNTQHDLVLVKKSRSTSPSWRKSKLLSSSYSLSLETLLASWSRSKAACTCSAGVSCSAAALYAAFVLPQDFWSLSPSQASSGAWSCWWPASLNPELCSLPLRQHHWQRQCSEQRPWTPGNSDQCSGARASPSPGWCCAPSFQILSMTPG